MFFLGVVRKSYSLKKDGQQTTPQTNLCTPSFFLYTTRGFAPHSGSGASVRSKCVFCDSQRIEMREAACVAQMQAARAYSWMASTRHRMPVTAHIGPIAACLHIFTARLDGGYAVKHAGRFCNIAHVRRRRCGHPNTQRFGMMRM